MELHFELKEWAVGIVRVDLQAELRCKPDVYVCIYFIPVDNHLDVTGKNRVCLKEVFIQGSVGQGVVGE